MKLFKGIGGALRKAATTILGVSVFGALIASSPLSAVAVNPQFNNLPDDYATLSAKKQGDSPLTTNLTGLHRDEVVTIVLWDHNTVLNSVARNVRLRIDLGNQTGTNLTARGYVSADNVPQPEVGTVNFSVSPESRLAYIPGSASFLSYDAAKNEYAPDPHGFPAGVNPDDIVKNGINIGDQSGCWEHAHMVAIQVRLEGGNPAINTNKRVEIAGSANGFQTEATAQPGDIVNFKVLVQNTGSATGKNTKIVDTLDPRLTYIPGSSILLAKSDNGDTQNELLDSLIKFEGQKITWAFDDMPPQAESGIYLIFQAKVAAAGTFPIGTTTFQNCAIAQFDGVSANTNCVTINVTRAADQTFSFSLRKEVTNKTLGDGKWYTADRLATAKPGDILRYRLVVINTGSATAQNVVLKDLLPQGVTFKGNVKLHNVGNENGIDVSGDAIVKDGYVFASLANGNPNTQTIEFDAQVGDNCNAGIITNTGEVHYGGQLKARSTAQTIVSCSRSLIIQKDVKYNDGAYVDNLGNTYPGQTLTYRITVINNGEEIARHPIVRDILPGNVTYVQGSLMIDGEKIVDLNEKAFFGQGMMLTDLEPGHGKTITFQVKVNVCPTDLTIINKAIAKGDNTPEVSDTAKATIVCAPSTTPPTTPTTPPKPGKPELPKTGPELGLLSLVGLSGAGYGGRWYLLKKKLQDRLNNLDVL